MNPDPFHTEDDPLDGMANLFDLGVVFSLGFVLALFGMSRSVAPTSQAGEAVPQERQDSPHYRTSAEEQGGQGMRLGVAYRLENGEVVFVPDQHGTE